MISFLRDLYVQIPGGYSDNRLNAAYAFSGFPLMVDTFYANFGITTDGFFEVDLPNINFHALRHTFATRALEASMDIKVLSSILGHAQASTTLNLYAHALPNHKRQSMEKMGSFYSTECSA